MAEFGPQLILKPAEMGMFFDHIPSVSVEVNGASKIFGHNQPLSLLERIIGNVMYCRTVEKLTRAVQTEEDENYSLHQRLKRLDEKFEASANQLKSRPPKDGIREIEKNLREEYDAMLKRDMIIFKETEMRNYRIKIDMDLDKKYREKALELEQVHLAKMSQVRERETKLYDLIQRKMEDLETADHTMRREYLLKLNEFEDIDKKIKKERQLKLSDLEAKEAKIDELEQQLKHKMKDVDSLRAELQFNNQQIEKRQRVAAADQSDNVMKNMHQMAEDTASLRSKLLSGEKQAEMIQKRLEDLQKENAALRNTNSAKEGEIRQLNDQITELLLKVRLFDQTNIGLLDRLRAQNESEEIILHAQKEHIVNLGHLSEKYNELLTENEKLRLQMAEQSRALEDGLKDRESRLLESLELLKKEKEGLVRREELEAWQQKYLDLEKKHKQLLRMQISAAAVGRPPEAGHKEYDFNASRMLDMLALDMQRLRSKAED